MNEAGSADAGLAAIGALIMLAWVVNGVLVIRHRIWGDHGNSDRSADRGFGQSRKI